MASHQRRRQRSESNHERSAITGRGQWFAKDYHPITNGSIDGTDIIAHDRALVRAMSTPFDPSQDVKIQGNPYRTLFVARLNRHTTTESTLHRHFDRFGRIRRLRLVRDIVTHESKGYAFIEYQHERDFREAYYRMHQTILDDRRILVEFERSRVMKGWKPRRLGGGLGGRKESGQLRFGGRDRPFERPYDPKELDEAMSLVPTQL